MEERRSLDAGGSLWVAAPDDDGEGVSVELLYVTLNVEQRTLVVEADAVEVDDDDGSRYLVCAPARFTCVLDTGELRPVDADARVFLEEYPWLEARFERQHMDHVRQRAWRALAQRDRETVARRVLASAEPGKMISFHRLFPADWDLLVLHDDVIYCVVDQYCPTPICDCSRAALTLYRVDDADAPMPAIGEAQVDLARARPSLDIEEVSSASAREAFAAFWEEYEYRLPARRAEARRAVLAYAPSRATAPTPPANDSRLPRNAPCSCGSGKKYKRCCLGRVAASPTGSPPPRA